MFDYVIRRLGFSVVTLVGMTVLIFLMIHLIPGDPVDVMTRGEADELTKQMMRKDLGLDKPLFLQYVTYMGRLIRGDLGRSLRTHQPVRSEILRRAGATVELAIFGMLISILIAVPVGILSATKPYSLIDYASMAASFLGFSMPVFWLGILLMLLLSIQFPLFPALGRGEPLFSSLMLVFGGQVAPLADSLRHLFLPAATLGFFNVGFIARMTRSCMLEVLNQEYIRTARSKGLPERIVVYKHALRNALIPIVTVVGMQFGFLLGGAVLTESVFAWPGLGRFIVESILARDYPFIQGGLLFLGTAFLIVNLLTDCLYGLINPQVRYD
jgi:peptide/nickel transport system permease protein